jgi:DNA-binding transcriptional ArsR family regulator
MPARSSAKHLRVLREAGLVQVRQEAQRRVYAIDPGPLAELDVWLAPYRRLWNERLDALGRHLDRTPGEEDDRVRDLRDDRRQAGRALRAPLPPTPSSASGAR